MLYTNALFNVFSRIISLLLFLFLHSLLYRLQKIQPPLLLLSQLQKSHFSTINAIALHC